MRRLLKLVLVPSRIIRAITHVLEDLSCRSKCLPDEADTLPRRTTKHSRKSSTSGLLSHVAVVEYPSFARIIFVRLLLKVVSLPFLFDQEPALEEVSIPRGLFT
jgi:hypothetical protein